MNSEEKVIKVVRIGMVPCGNRRESLFCKVRLYGDGRLAVTGVIGPRRTGNCQGSCGQVIINFRDYDERGRMALADIKFARGWTAELARRFFDAWDAWHLKFAPSETLKFLAGLPVADRTPAWV